MSAGLRIILDGANGDLIGQAKAAAYALTEPLDPNRAFRIGVCVDGRYYGIHRNKLTVRVYPQDSEPENLSRAASDVLVERKRQINIEGWSPEHDDQHTQGEMALAAAAYARHAAWDEDARQVNSGFSPEDLWPKTWWNFWKPSDRRRDLVKAGALIIAEIERLDRAAAAPPAEPGA